jgi:hypothetical protein
MSVNGAFTSKPAAAAIASANPNGGQPPYPTHAPAPTSMADNVVTTNAQGAFASHVRPHS